MVDEWDELLALDAFIRDGGDPWQVWRTERALAVTL